MTDESSHTRPTPPIELTGAGTHLEYPPTELTPGQLDTLGTICETVTSADEIGEASRDWWPLALHWSIAGETPTRASAVCRPRSTDEVAGVLRFANDAFIPVAAAGGRSSVTGSPLPLYGGIVLDMTEMRGVVSIDDESLTAEVFAGTFGPDYEGHLRDRGLTGGHYPQSMDISTVGGWLACRGAGQYSTRYGKIEDIVTGLEVVLADGNVVHTGGAPKAAVGPDLTQLFVGSEGTLGIITKAWLRVHPVATSERRAAFGFSSFVDGVEACRRILRRGATPAVLRLYDGQETQRSHGGDGSVCALLVLDEGDPAIVDATMTVVSEECAPALPLDVGLVAGWMTHRNDTGGLQALTRKGFVVDTMEIAAPWSKLATLFDDVRAALMSVPTARAATCHLSHSYLDGACLYFTFAATPEPADVEATYVAMWDAGTRATLAGGGNLSHHHGVGLNRSRFVAESLGTGLDVLRAVKDALDPNGVLNPGKLGLTTVIGSTVWP